mmetsp:Transcript_80706/g.223248  ORF Transcript_80706/g.223248 Transcript_80706/m.223248 type:complete len:207 (+) Transcript_80706:284-904(+)
MGFWPQMVLPSASKYRAKASPSCWQMRFMPRKSSASIPALMGLASPALPMPGTGTPGGSCIGKFGRYEYTEPQWQKSEETSSSVAGSSKSGPRCRAKRAQAAFELKSPTKIGKNVQPVACSIPKATNGICISMLCSASSSRRLNSPKSPVRRSAPRTSMSSGKSPSGVAYVSVPTAGSAHPSNHLWCDGPSATMRLVAPGSMLAYA